MSKRCQSDMVLISLRYHFDIICPYYLSDIAEIVRFIQIFAQCRRDVESVIEYRDNIVATSRLYKYHHIAEISRGKYRGDIARVSRGYRGGIAGKYRGNIAARKLRRSCEEVARKWRGSCEEVVGK